MIDYQSSCVYQENTSDSWDIPWYITRKRCITSIYMFYFKCVLTTFSLFQPLRLWGRCRDVLNSQGMGGVTW